MALSPLPARPAPTAEFGLYRVAAPVRSILVLEDDANDVLLLAAKLPDDCTMVHVRDLSELARIAESGELERERVEVVLVDLAVPGSIGLETYKRVREVLPHLPLVVVTGYDDDHLARAAITSGAQDFVTKRDLAAMPWDRLGRVLMYAKERHSLLCRLEEMRQAQARAEQMEHERQLQLVAAQKLEAIGRMAAGMAHELNTPIQFVGDNTRFVRDTLQELLDGVRAIAADESLPEEVRARLDELDLDFVADELPTALGESIDGLERMGRLVRAIKEFAHPGGEGKTPSDVNRLIETTSTVSRGEWKYVASLELDLADDLPHIPLEADGVTQVVLNIKVNAAQAIGEQERDDKGAIKVTTRWDEQAEEVQITIEDDGPGIPDHIAAQIWEPFFTTKPPGIGSGQGLAIARNIIVNEHGGHIGLRTGGDTGTCFEIHLPQNPPAADDPADPHSEDAAGSGTAIREDVA